jgi:ADP-ribosylglycohydrolase
LDRNSIEYVSGCLLGGAVGDALGAPVEFASLADIRARYGPDGITDYVQHGHLRKGSIGTITDDTQMTLFTAEGLIRAGCRAEERGICDPVAVVHHAYIRWLHTQGLHSKCTSFDENDDGWLIKVQALHSRRSPGNTCVSALTSGIQGTARKPINSSKGCGGIMRAAPIGLWCEAEQAFEMGCGIAAITHGHPSGYLAAGFFACMISRIIAGDSLRTSIDVARVHLTAKPDHDECLTAVTKALTLAQDRCTTPGPEAVERLGQGWVAEEALAISLYCGLSVDEGFDRAVLLAVNHSGDSDSTGAITGNILGAIVGRREIPDEWLEGLELRAEIEQIAQDLITRFRHDRAWWERYPGW